MRRALRGFCLGRVSAPACAIAALGLALAGCSYFQGPPPPVTNPNLFPSDYKESVMALMQLNPYGLVGTREAYLSPPELKPFGTESRYVSCLRAIAPDAQREKMIVFWAGQVNQFVDATADACQGAAYQPFPELPRMLSQIKSKAK